MCKAGFGHASDAIKLRGVGMVVTTVAVCLVAVNSFFFFCKRRCNLHEGSRLDIIRGGFGGLLRRTDPLALGDSFFYAKAISHLALFFFFKYSVGPNELLRQARPAAVSIKL